ncbi:hypothetical protein IT399_03485 [Candidatus Nomurabacteria bacterium]|nr:hypothetical protein [Candidatus Nomurabacteria bacterium]
MPEIGANVVLAIQSFVKKAGFTITPRVNKMSSWTECEKHLVNRGVDDLGHGTLGIEYRSVTDEKTYVIVLRRWYESGGMAHWRPSGPYEVYEIFISPEVMVSEIHRKLADPRLLFWGSFWKNNWSWS